jgi:hypothetical protein
MQGIDDLLVATGAQGGDHQRLRLAAGEQRRAVGARQHADADVIGRTVRVSRPSMRGSPLRIWLRTIFASRSNKMLPTRLASGAFSTPSVRARWSAW